MSELRTTAEIASWLAVGLALRRVATAGGEPSDAGPWNLLAIDAVSSALRACANELPALPPAGVIADVAALLGGGRPLTSAASPDDDALRAALRAYDDDVVARLLATPRFDDAIAAYAHAAPADRGPAVALIAGALCERTQLAGTAVSPAALRRALARSPHQHEAAAQAGLSDPAIAGALADAYQQLARGSRRCRALVDDRDVFAIDHLGVLRDLGGRMTAAHIGAAADAIAQRLPRRLPARRERRGLRETRLADDTLYPAGGFASITPGGATTGNIENLVTSELVYMDDDASDSIDVFSVRYVEGELLHYTRDDSVFRRHRHLIAIAIAGDLEGARVKDRDLPWQRVILALGLLVAGIRWLVDQLGDEALTVHLGVAPGALVEERQIMSLLLDGEIARGTLVITEQDERETIALAQAASGTAIADAIIVSRGAPPVLPRGVRALHLQLASAAPTVRELAPRPAEPTGGSRDPWNEWCDAAEDVLRWLI